MGSAVVTGKPRGVLPLSGPRYYNTVTMALIILRCIFTLALAGLAVSIINASSFPQQPEWLAWAVMGGLLSLAGGVVAVDLGIRRKRLDVISSVYFGLIVGLSLAHVALLVIGPLVPEKFDKPNQIWLELVLGLVLCYTCISLLLQTKDDFRFVIPYVEFCPGDQGHAALHPRHQRHHRRSHRRCCRYPDRGRPVGDSQVRDQRVAGHCR